MNKLTRLQQQAVNAAKRLDWQAAIEINSSLLELNPKDLGALNRLGVAFIQNGQAAQAKATFEQVIALDKSNSIAIKHMTGIATNQTMKAPSFTSEQFIEEPGTTKIVELHRLANKNVLFNLSIGQPCSLVPKNRYLSIETQGNEYVGALPEDLSFRLTKLIKRGNEYECFVYSTTEKSCSVYLKEAVRSAKNSDLNSFPQSKTALTAINDVDESFLLEDNIPVEIVETDNDQERTLDDIETEDEKE